MAASVPSIQVLLGAAGDADESVREEICKALVRLGAAQPEEFIPLAVEHLRGGRLGGVHRALVLRGTTEVARGAKGALGPQHLVDVLLEPAVTELMRSRDPEPVLAAQDLLCLLGEGTPDAVLRALLAHCEAGVLPQPCVLRTLADVANARPAVGVPALKMELLPRIMPQLGAAKGEARVACAYALQNYANAVAQLLHERGENHDSRKAAAAAVGLLYGSEMASALEYTFTQWLPLRDDALRFAAAEALAAMIGLLAPEQMQPLLPRLIPGLLAALKKEKEWERLPVTQALWAALAHAEACELGGIFNEEELLQRSLSALHSLLCAPLDRNCSATLRTHNEQLRCFEVLGQLYPEATLSFLLKALEASASSTDTRCGTMEVLRHLVSRLPRQLQGLEPMLLAGVSLLLPELRGPELRGPKAEPECRARLALTELVGTLGSQGHLQHEGGQKLVLFMVRQAAIPDADAEEVPRRRDAVSAGLLREVGTKTLDLLCSTVPGMRAVLWPLLFECLVPSAAESLPEAERDLTPAASVVCKCLLQLASRLATQVRDPPPPPQRPVSATPSPPCAPPVRLHHASAAPPPPSASPLPWPTRPRRAVQAPEELTLPFVTNPNLPSPHALFVRLLLLVCVPHRRPLLGERALLLLLRLAPQLHPALPPLWDNHVPKLLAFLQQAQWDEAPWTRLWLRFVSDSLDVTASAADGPSWLRAVGEEALRQLGSMSLLSEPQLKAALLMLLGRVVERSGFKELLERGMHAMLAATRPPPPRAEASMAAARPATKLDLVAQATVRRGCAEGFGSLAASHLDPALEALQAALRTASVTPAASGGFFSFLSAPARPTEAAEAELATILLCIGHAASRATPSLLLPRAELLAATALLPPAKDARGLVLRVSAASAFELMAAALFAAAKAAEDSRGLPPLPGGVAAGFPGNLPGDGWMPEWRGLEARHEMVEVLLGFLEASGGAVQEGAQELVISACSACSLLVSLPPAPSPQLAERLLRAIVEHMHAPPESGADAEAEGSVGLLTGSCGSLLEALLSLRLPATALFPLLGALLPLCHSLQPHERLRAVHLAARLLARELELRAGKAPAAADTGMHPTAAAALHQGQDALNVKLAATVAAEEPSVLEAWRLFVSTAPTTAEPVDAAAASAEAWGGPTALGDAIGMVLPRSCDPDAAVRRGAARCVMSLLQLAVDPARLAAEEAGEPSRGGLTEGERREAVGEAVDALQACCASSELQPRLEAQRRLVPALQAVLPAAALQQLVRTLVAGLAAEWHGAAAACVALNGLLGGAGEPEGRARARPLHEVAPEVVSSLLQVLPQIDEEMPRLGALAVLRSIGRHNLEPVMSCLLMLPLPLPPPAVTVVQRLARDEQLLEGMLSRLTEVINDAELAAPAGSSAPPASSAAAAVELLTAVLEEEEAALVPHRPQLVASLILRLGAARDGGAQAEAAARGAVRAFLGTLPDEPGAAEEAEEAPAPPQLSMDFDDGIALESPLSSPTRGHSSGGEGEQAAAAAEAAPAATDNDSEGEGEEEAEEEEGPCGKAALLAALDRGAESAAIARGLGSLLGDGPYHACGVRQVFERLYPYVSSRHALQRESLTAAVAQFVTAAGTDTALTRHIVHMLLGRLNDEAAPVRLHALLGLRRLGEASGASADLQLEVGQMLGSLAAALDDADEAVALAAFGALRRALPSAPLAAVHPLLLSVCVRARAAAERGSAAVRAAGFSLFGLLVRFADAESVRDSFVEHGHSLLPSLLLHLRHPHPAIRRACATSTRALAPLLRIPVAAAAEVELRSLGEKLGQANPERVSAYLTGCAELFGAEEACVRADAAQLAGTLLASALPSGGAGAQSLVYAQLGSMLKDSDAAVRLQAARALG